MTARRRGGAPYANACGALPPAAAISASRVSSVWSIERLEPRTLLAFAPIGPEFRVNNFTTNNQQDASVASDADGDFVLAWQSLNQDGPGSGVYAQSYNAAGAPQGGEFRVNTVPGDNRTPAVASDADGDFVVAWASNNLDGSGWGIYARRYDAAGAARGGEFRVNTFTTGNQTDPCVAADADGDFVVAWDSYGQDGDGLGVYARRFTPDGLAQGGEFRVNTTTANDQSMPSVALDATGDFVVAWHQAIGQNVYAQRYNAAGAAQGGEFRVNTFGASNFFASSVAADRAGAFVIAWNGYDGVYAQRYDADGVAQGGEFTVNTFSAGNQSNPSVAADADGDFVVAWQSNAQDGSGSGVYAQRYDAAGAARGGEFRVNTFTTGNQVSPSVASDADGDLVAAWQSDGQDGSGFGVFAQRFDESTDAAGPIVSGVAAAGASIAPDQRLVSSVAQFTVYFSENLSTLGGVAGANSPTNPANWTLTRNGADVSSIIQSVTFGFNASANKYQAVLTLAQAQGEGSYVLTAKGNLRDPPGNALDGNRDGVPGGDYTLPFVIQFPVNVGPEFRVNTYTTDRQSFPSVAVDADGDFVVAWQSYGQDGSGLGVYAQRYNAAGVAQSGEFRVNTFTSGHQYEPSVAADADGDFVVAWQSYGQDGSSGGVYAQRYDAVGVPQGGEFRVNTFTTGDQSGPSVAADADGDFVVAWRSYSQDGSASGVYAQRYSAAGAAQGGEFRVNTFTSGNQYAPSVAADADGDFVVAWNSFGQDGSGLGVYAQRYNAAGATQGTEFRVNTFTAGDQFGPSVASDADGDFVVAWQSSAQDGSGWGVYAQRYSAAGAALGGEFRINTFTAGHQDSPCVAADADGDFVVAWQSDAQDGSEYGVYAQRYNAAGEAQGGEFRVNTFTAGDQFRPSVAADADGDFVVAWQSYGQDGSNYGVYAQRYRANETPTTLGIPSVTVAEDEADTVTALRPSFADSTDALTALAIALTGNTNPSLFSSATINPADGTLTLDYAPDQSGSAQLTVRATDTGGLSVETTVTVTVNPVNDAPVNAVPGRQVVEPGALLVFGEATRNAITVSDIDVGRGDVMVTLEAEPGYTLQLSRVRGIEIVEDGGNRLRFAGNVVDVNAALDGLSLTPFGAITGETTLTITTDDQGGAGAGGALSDTDVVSVFYGDALPPPPKVTAVFVNGTGWTAPFRNYLAAHGLGDATLGFAIPSGTGQLADLPWAGINQVSIRFDKDVLVSDANLAVRGVTIGGYATQQMTYAASTHTATWTLAQAVRNDKLLLDLDGDAGGVHDADGGRLDGEWAGAPDAFPSGDGTPGGDFRFRLNLLPGDIDRSGSVLANDFSAVKARFFKSTTSPVTGTNDYSPFHDVDGSGSILANDFSAVKARFFNTLPGGEPTSAATAVVAARRHISPLRKMVLGA